MAITTTRYAIFNGYNLNNVPGLSVYAISPPGQANRGLSLLALARISGRKLSSAFYTNNQIRIGVYITAATREKLEAAMDTLYANLQTTEASLVVPMSGGTARMWTATYADTVINNALSGTDSPAAGYADLTLVFEASDSFGYDQFFTPMLGPLSNLTSSPNTWQWTFGGGADSQVPFLQFYYTGGTLGSGTVVVGNNGSGQNVSITRVWAVGDTLQIDCKNNTVRVNGVDVNFTGSIPQFGLGQQQINYSDNFTSRTYQFYSYVYQRWI